MVRDIDQVPLRGLSAGRMPAPGVALPRYAWATAAPLRGRSRHAT